MGLKGTKNKFKLIGLNIDEEDKTNQLPLGEYIQKFELIPESVIFDIFPSMRARLNWISNSCPDISCIVYIASAVTEKILMKATLNH